jgi:hypothetical protein
MRYLLIGVFVLPLGSFIAVTPAELVAQEFCYGCVKEGEEPYICDQVFPPKIGGEEGCHHVWVCYQGHCSDTCAPKGALCNIEPEALAMSGQVVRPYGEVVFDAHGLPRRNCDNALLFGSDREPIHKAARIEFR